MLTAGLAGFPQIEEHAHGAIDAVTRNKRRANQSDEPGVLLRVVRDRVLQPVVIPARSHFEDPTHHLHAVAISMSLDECVRGTNSSRDLVRGLWHRSSAKSRMLAPIH